MPRKLEGEKILVTGPASQVGLPVVRALAVPDNRADEGAGEGEPDS